MGGKRRVENRRVGGVFRLARYVTPHYDASPARQARLKDMRNRATHCKYMTCEYNAREYLDRLCPPHTRQKLKRGQP